MTKASPARAGRRAGQPTPTELTLTDEAFAAFSVLGLERSNFDAVIQQEQTKGTSQEDFDAMLKTEGERATAAHAANEAAKAEQVAAERKVNRLAIAGMALQGLLANVTPQVETEVAARAVVFADALLDALDKPVEAE